MELNIDWTKYSGNSVVELLPDNEVSIQDMENQFYQGYPKWRRDDYKEQKDILLKLISKPDFDHYDKASNVSISILWPFPFRAVKSNFC